MAIDLEFKRQCVRGELHPRLQDPAGATRWAKHVCVPTFLFQVHDDVLTDPSDLQTMFDNIPVADKKLHWIRDTSARWDGYLEFQRRPEPALEWFEKHMA